MNQDFSWMPCSPWEKIDDLVWVKRMAQKARRAQESCGSGADVMNGYLYGDNDFIDGRVLRFLGMSAAEFSAEVCGAADDETGVRRALAASPRSATERREFSAKLEKDLKSFPIIDADEGRLPPGFKTSALKFFYNRLMMPIVYAIFRRADVKQKKV